MSEVPPEQQCTMPSCSERATELGRGGLCGGHLDGPETTPTEPEPAPEPEDAETGPWTDADFTQPESGVWASDRLNREQWMGHVEKQPFSPWADRDAPANCSEDGHTTAEECGCDARFKWGYSGNYADGETVAMAEDDPRLDGRAFIQQTDDGYGYVDGDDVRDPETGDVHPAFIAVLNRLGLTYADISQSDGGSHAAYRGELPEGVKQAAWQLDDESFGENDDLPSIEIYAGKRVCVDTGKHVPGTPTETREWDDDALLDILDENDQLPELPPKPEGERFDSSEHDPDATSSDETTGEIRDLYTALDRLNTHHVADKTIVHRWNDDASTSGGTRAFAPTWGRNSNGTANIVDDKIWQDTGDEAGYGGPVVMALIDLGEMSHRNASPRKATGALWWKGVEHLRKLGFDIPELDESKTDGEREIVATLPNSPRTRAAANGQRWTDDHGADANSIAPSQQDVYDRVYGVLDDAMNKHKQVVVDAIMGGGKTYNFFGALFDRGEPGAYFAPRTELYDQAVEYAEANGFNRGECYILPSIVRHCPTWNGEHGEDQRYLIQRLYGLGVQPKTIHNILGDELGCRQNDTGKCEYEHRCNFDPDDYAVLIGHYAHSHLPHVTKGRHCAFDEDPQNAFTTHLGGSQLIKGVNSFLGMHESPPFDGWDDLIQHRNDTEKKQAGLAWFDRPEFDFEPDEQNAVRFENEGFHAYAPLAVYTILKSEPLEDGYAFEQASLPGLGDTGQFFTTSEQSGEHYVELSTPPDLEYANAIIALDGTPLIQDGKPVEWVNALDRGRLDHRQVLTDDERGEFLSETQGIAFIQTSEFIKPYSSGKWKNANEDAALLAAVRETYGDGDPPVVFTDKKVRDHYEDAGFVDKGLAETFDHPGNLRGSNEYADCRLAVQLGSSHHGDHEVRRRAAMLGETVEPEGKGAERDYGSDLGNGIVYQMREAQSAQNALRIGRDGNGALFIFETCAFPDWIPVEEGVADVSVWSKAEQAIRDVWGEFDARERNEGLSAAVVSEAIGTAAGGRHTRTCLDRLASRGYLKKTDDPDDARRNLWIDTGLGEVSEHQAAEIELPEMDFEEQADEAGMERLPIRSIREISASSLHHIQTSAPSIDGMSNNVGEGGLHSNRPANTGGR